MLDDGDTYFGWNDPTVPQPPAPTSSGGLDLDFFADPTAGVEGNSGTLAGPIGDTLPADDGPYHNLLTLQ